MNAITGEHPVEREEIMMFMDGELAAGRAVFVSRHLESCPARHRALADFRATSQSLSHWAVHPAPMVLPAWPENRLPASCRF